MSVSVVERLGFAPGTRVVIVHADDVGMCHAANAAFWEVQSFGVVTCGAVMMPCPWVPEMAAWCRAHPEADVGVHLTLTSEHSKYRWRPLSTSDPKSGLVDEDGYMWRTVEDLYQHMDPDAAIAELRAQVELAVKMGIDVTHVDTHMGAVMHPRLFMAYVLLAMEHRIPAMLPRIPKERMSAWGVDPEQGQAFVNEMDRLVAQGLPVLDGISAARGHDNDLAVYRRLFAAVSPGITHLLLHPAIPGADLEVISGALAYRITDYETFLRADLKAYIAEQGIELIGYRRLRDLMRGE